MNQSDLKKILKPLIKQCIKEVIFEEGVLSGIISEVAVGLTTPQQILEQKSSSESVRKDNSSEIRDRLRRSTAADTERRSLLDAIGKDSYNGVNIFEGTEPLTSGGSPGNVSTSAADPLSNYAPNDPGVNIEGILAIGGNKWAKFI